MLCAACSMLYKWQSQRNYSPRVRPYPGAPSPFDKDGYRFRFTSRSWIPLCCPQGSRSSLSGVEDPSEGSWGSCFVHSHCWKPRFSDQLDLGAWMSLGNCMCVATLVECNRSWLKECQVIRLMARSAEQYPQVHDVVVVASVDAVTQVSCGCFSIMAS